MTIPKTNKKPLVLLVYWFDWFIGFIGLIWSRFEAVVHVLNIKISFAL